MKKVLFLASGSGSNVMAILDALQEADVQFKLITNNTKAGVLSKLESYPEIETQVFSNADFANCAASLLDYMDNYAPDVIVLAGFLRSIAPEIITRYEGRIINIHPSLLPKYGGLGMYGMHVHRAVFDAKETHSGITIHEVSQEYDKGKIILQAEVDITSCSSPEEIATRVLKLEHAHFYKVVRAKLGL